MSEIYGDRVHAKAVEEEGVDGNIRYGEGLHIEEGTESPVSVAADLKSRRSRGCFSLSLCFIQKLIAGVLGTYFMIFAGCASIVVNLKTGAVTFPGICIVWGLVVMVMIYSLGHISGAHFNPAVTIASATCKRFPWKQVPAYISAQVLGSTLASGTLRLLFDLKHEHYFETISSGSNVQSFVLEFIISFYLMFVISGVSTDNRAIGELAGSAVGATVLLNILSAGPVSGASMNPVRSLGPAIVFNRYEGIWVYMVGPICGTVMGACAYNLICYTDKPLHEIIHSTSRRACLDGQRIEVK